MLRENSWSLYPRLQRVPVTTTGFTDTASRLCSPEKQAVPAGRLKKISQSIRAHCVGRTVEPVHQIAGGLQPDHVGIRSRVSQPQCAAAHRISIQAIPAIGGKVDAENVRANGNILRRWNDEVRNGRGNNRMAAGREIIKTIR